ncbi:amino acid ABC transporter permease [Oscillospiraceae bacterium]|uniref:amino acid ABC transporter permease n=1 Tax=Allofournierella sp. TaxID=1940256 RepID=UPI0015ADC31A|nr:amino acid ABC transporter permease [Oscillospiraceae bacterium]
MSFLQVTLELLQGFKTTCLIFAVTLAASLPLGLVVCLGSMSRFAPLRWLTRTFIWIIRGTPLMLQVLVVFYVPGLAFGMPMHNRLAAVLAAFIINYAAYFSEIYRGGIEGIPQGQWEAGQVLGMTRAQIFGRIVLLQVTKRILPPMSNEIITLVKDTSLARVIAVGELIRAAQDIAAQRALVWPLFYTGVFYLAFSGLLTLLFGWAERKLNYYKG